MIDGPSSVPKRAANDSVVSRLEERGRESVLSAERKFRDEISIVLPHRSGDEENLLQQFFNSDSLKKN